MSEGMPEAVTVPAGLVAWNGVVRIPTTAREFVKIITGINLSNMNAWKVFVCVARAHDVLQPGCSSLQRPVERVQQARSWRQGLRDYRRLEAQEILAVTEHERCQLWLQLHEAHALCCHW